jgi:hypothetical protein
MQLARVAHGEISFEATGFAVGQGGYQYSDPVLISPIDPTQTTLIAQFFPTPQTQMLTCTVTLGSNTVSTTSTSNLRVGYAVSGTGIPASTYISSIPSSGTFTINNAAVAPATNPGSLQALTFTTTTQPLQDIEYPTPQTCVMDCRLQQTDAVAGLGELGVWATIIHSTVTPTEVGTSFLFAVAHFPILAKTINQITVFRVIIQF